MFHPLQKTLFMKPVFAWSLEESCLVFAHFDLADRALLLLHPSEPQLSPLNFCVGSHIYVS